MEDVKIAALCKHFKVTEDQVTDEGNDRYSIESKPGEYWVLTDDEANDAWSESLDNCIDECILPELPEFSRKYFDSEKWKRDAEHDGRGHSLSPYDGVEHEVRLDDKVSSLVSVYMYIYRVN